MVSPQRFWLPSLPYCLWVRLALEEKLGTLCPCAAPSTRSSDSSAAQRSSPRPHPAAHAFPTTLVAAASRHGHPPQLPDPARRQSPRAGCGGSLSGLESRPGARGRRSRAARRVHLGHGARCVRRAPHCALGSAGQPCSRRRPTHNAHFRATPARAASARLPHQRLGAHTSPRHPRRSSRRSASSPSSRSASRARRPRRRSTGSVST